MITVKNVCGNTIDMTNVLSQLQITKKKQLISSKSFITEENKGFKNADMTPLVFAIHSGSHLL